MTPAVFNIEQLKSDYAPDTDAPRQNSRSEQSAFGEFVMAAVDQSEVDEQAMPATLRHAAVAHSDAPEATAGETSAVESGPVNEGTELKDGSVDAELLGGNCFPRSAPTHISRSGNQGDEAWNGKALPAAGSSGTVATPRVAESEHGGAEGAPRFAESVRDGAESMAGRAAGSTEVGVAAPPQPVMHGDALNGAQQSPDAERMISPRDVSADGSAKAAVDEKEIVALRQIAVPRSGAAGKSLGTPGVDPATAEDANESTNNRSGSGERYVSAEADGPDSAAVEVPLPPASVPPAPSGMRLATPPVDMTNDQQLNEEFSVAAPRDGVLATSASASATATSARSAQLSEVIARIDEHFLPMVKSGGNTFTLSLEPAHLGFLTINCRESANQFTIEVVTESAVTQEFLATRADELRDIAARCGFESPRVDIHAEADSLMQRERERRYTPPRQSRHASGGGPADARSAGPGTDDSIRIPTLAAGVLAVA